MSIESLIKYLLRGTLLLAGFSQVKFGFISPVEILMIFLFFVLALNSHYNFKVYYFFFIFSVIYAFLLGGMTKPYIFISEIFAFSLFFSLVNFCKKLDEEQIASYLKYFNFSMLISNSLALFILFKIPQLRDFVIDISSIGFRFKGFFNQPNNYAFVLIISIPIAVYIFIRNKTVFNFFSVLVGFVSLVFTQSRGAIFGLISAFIIVYIVYTLQKDTIRRIKNLMVSIFVLGVSVLVIFLVFPQYLESKYDLNLSRINPTRKKESERSLTAFSVKQDRYFLVNSALQTIVKNPLGLGFQDHHTVIGKTTGVYLVPHNYFLTLLLNYGILIGLIWNGIIAYTALTGFKIIRKRNVNPKCLFFYLHILMISVLLYYLSHSAEWSYFYMILAFYYSYLLLQKREYNLIERK